MINFSTIPDRAHTRCCNNISSDAYVFITSSERAYSYCSNAHRKDSKIAKERSEELFKYITDPRDAYVFCKLFKDCPEVYNNITDPHWAMAYCAFVKMRPEVKQYVSKDKLELKQLSENLNVARKLKIYIVIFILYLILLSYILISKVI